MMSNSIISPTKATFVFVVGEQVYSGNGYVKSLSMRYDRPMEMVGFGSITHSLIKTPNMFDLDVSIRALDLTVSDGEKISRKLVGDATIEELIFAITEKAKSNSS